MAADLIEDEAEAHVRGVCFKTGPPATTGVELEWLVQDRSDPRALIPVERLDAALAPVEIPGAMPGGSSVTREPGGQVELSSPPAGSPVALVEAMAADVAALRRRLESAGLVLVGRGLDPYRDPPRILEHPRYRAMECFFDREGPWGRTMMRRTASLQVNLDSGDDSDGMTGYRRRWELAHRLGPVLVAAFANSALRDGRPTGWVSTRQAVWARMDAGRTHQPRHDRDPRTAWARYALDARVLCIRDAERPGPAPGPGVASSPGSGYGSGPASGPGRGSGPAPGGFGPHRPGSDKAAPGRTVSAKTFPVRALPDRTGPTAGTAASNGGTSNSGSSNGRASGGSAANGAAANGAASNGSTSHGGGPAANGARAADWTAPPGLTFRGWLRGVPGLRRPTTADLDYHLSTLFPPVRPRGWLELRMVDAQHGDDWIVATLVTAALLDDPIAADAAYAATAPLCPDGQPLPSDDIWRRAARIGPADPELGRAVRACFAAADSALARSGTPAALREAVGGFAERYAERGRCPAHDQLDALSRV